MKPLLAFTFACLVSSCSSWKKPLSPPPIVLVDEKPESLNTSERNNLRTDESIKKYAIGRYVDPSSGLVMHEAHDVYRVEATSKWNRRPLRSPSRIKETNPSSHRDTELARLRQNLRLERANSQAARQATETLRTQIEPLTKAVGTAQELAKQNAQLRKQIRDSGHSPQLPVAPQTETEVTTENPDSVKERLRDLFKPNSQKQ